MWGDSEDQLSSESLTAFMLMIPHLCQTALGHAGDHLSVCSNSHYIWATHQPTEDRVNALQSSCPGKPHCAPLLCREPPLGICFFLFIPWQHPYTRQWHDRGVKYANWKGTWCFLQVDQKVMESAWHPEGYQDQTIQCCGVIHLTVRCCNMD